MNWADLTFVMTPLICALSAGTAAAEQKVGWASWLFTLGGLGIGFGFAIAIRRLAMLLLVGGCKQSRSFVTFALLMAYMLVPLAAMVAAFAGTAWLSTWIAGCFV